MSLVEPIPVTALERLPIFPLHSVQMFPNALLPLHVFEPRYRDLVADCVKNANMFAIATLEPGFADDYAGRPPVRPLCGVGRIIAHDQLPDGRSNMLLHGLGRVRIVEELPPVQSYRLVRAERMIDQPASAELARSIDASLRIFIERLATRLPSGTETLNALLETQQDLGALTDLLAATVVTDPDRRLAIFETLEVAGRAELLTGELAHLLSQIEDTKQRPN